MNNNPIGIFDSGMGGLSVLYQAVKVLPNENYIYYADTDNVPYGLKTNEQINKYLDNAFEFFTKKNVKAVVIACNTATSVGIENERQKYNIPIIGIEPAVKPAIKINKEKRILLIATPVTIKEKKLENLLKEFDKDNKVDLLALPRLVEFAEKEEFASSKVENYLKQEFKKLNLENYSELVLGCTHFNYFKPTLKKIFNDNINILDGNEGIVNRLKNVLNEKEILGNVSNTNIEYYFSGRLVNNKENLKQIERLHNRLEEVYKL